MDETQFAEGMSVYKPSDKAPDFIKANIVVNVTDFTRWMEAHANPEGKVRIVVKESKGGKYYAQLDQYTVRPDQQRIEPDTNDTTQFPASGDDTVDQIPF